MRFLYLYPTYEMAREAFLAKEREVPDKADINNLTLVIGSDEHVFRYVPIKVNVDLERLGYDTGIVYTYPLIESLIDAVKFELVQLAEYTLGAGRLEYGKRSVKPATIQTSDVAPSGGTGTTSSAKLGTEGRP